MNDIALSNAINTTTTTPKQVKETPLRKQVDYSPAAIANYCGRGEQSGKDWKCNCPICGKHSLSVTYGLKTPILIKCWYCDACEINNGYTEQRKLLVDAGLLPQDSHWIRRLTPAERQKYYEAKREQAVRSWEASVPIRADSVAAKYLKARGLDSFVSHPALRSFPPETWAYHSPGRFRPVLVSRLWHVSYGVCGVQFTYLNFDGDDRDRELQPGRKTFGPRKGAAVWIGAPKPDEEFVVGEGLETVLSAMLVLKIRCGGAVLGPDFKNLVLPSTANCVLIAADNGDTGRGAAAHTAGLWRQRGLKVRVSMPDKEGEDFNDVLLRKGSWS